MSRRREIGIVARRGGISGPPVSRAAAQHVSSNGRSTGEATDASASVRLRYHRVAVSLSPRPGPVSSRWRATAIGLWTATLWLACGLPEDNGDIPGARRVFITDGTYGGALGGLDGADAICQREADIAGLVGGWRAWLADSTGSPPTRFETRGTFVRLDGMIIADDWDDLLDFSLDAPIMFTASGQVPPAGHCWSNVGLGGIAREDSCRDWTSTSSTFAGSRAQYDLTDHAWSFNGSQNCDPNLVPPLRLYCFEQ